MMGTAFQQDSNRRDNKQMNIDKIQNALGHAFGQLCVFGVVVYTAMKHPPVEFLVTEGVNLDATNKYESELLKNLKRFSNWCKKTSGKPVAIESETTPAETKPEPKPEAPIQEPQRFMVKVGGELVVIQVKPGGLSDSEIYYSFDLLNKLHQAQGKGAVTVTRVFENGQKIQIVPDIPAQQRD